MSADRETNHDMTDRDIALLLADAADEVEIGIAPYQAVVRGGRRRRARRWAIATATALVIAGTSGTLALAGLRDGSGGEVTPAVTHQSPTPPTAEERHVYAPQETVLAVGNDQGKDWTVSIDVWGAPQNYGEAARQLSAMATFGVQPPESRKADDLIGKTSYFVRLDYGDKRPKTLLEDTVAKQDVMSELDMVSGSVPLGATGPGAPDRLVVGRVAKTAQQVTCTWKNGTTTVAHRVPAGSDVNSDEAVIRPADGTPVNWFVCAAPAGTAFKGAGVSKVG
jgi:hypothetical protein